MNLFILRHGIAVEPGTPGFDSDADRPLTAKGRRRVRQIAGAMREMELSFDLIFSSPFPRALQTAEIVAAVFKRQKKLTCTNELTPGGSAKSLVGEINKIKPPPENVLLVGHEPYLSRFIGLLAAGNTDMEIDFKKGGLCKLEIESLRHGRCATLAWLLTPRQMKLMAKSG
jgi:phosphohistidine phosphatase